MITRSETNKDENRGGNDTSSSIEITPLEKLGWLQELARDLRWAGDPRADALWKRVDPRLWELTENPWFILQTVSVATQLELLKDPDFDRELIDLGRIRRHDLEGQKWFNEQEGAKLQGPIAYFSMEFMLSEALPIYSGGLGNVAGDQLKAASDLGVPVVGVGLLYQRGYFRQSIDAAGNQQALFPYNDPSQMPMTPVRGADGELFRLEIALPGYSVWVRAWEVQVGRAKLYLLDSNDVANFPAYRGITSELYGGETDLRLKQEILLGIGGWRLLNALGIHPSVCHLNEGHAAFAILERAREYMLSTGQSFETALATTRAGNLFTTHTAVAAGFDRFDPALLEHYLGRYAQKLGISFGDLLALGRLHREDPAEPFNMAYLALRGSGAVNAVSQLHERVSRKLFAPIYPRQPEGELSLGHVTNGIHVASWCSLASFNMWTMAEGRGLWSGAGENSHSSALEAVSDEELWHLRNCNRQELVKFTRERLCRERAVRGASDESVESAHTIFDPSVLTIVFARRFASYKRPNLLLSDPSRLIRLLTNRERPVQLIIAGKAHPADRAGQAMIQEWMRFIQHPEVARRVAFLSDYDMHLTGRLVQGADVWLNTPERPWEACGTSGMKILANGGINLSELDGWWAEQYCADLGWALGDGAEHGGDPTWNQTEADLAYGLLEEEIIPEFYRRNAEGMPKAWVDRMRHSMAELTSKYSADRAVREYTTKYYLPAASNYHHRSAHDGAEGIEIARWRHRLELSWPSLQFIGRSVEQREDSYLIRVELRMGSMGVNDMAVEIYADNPNGSIFRREMKQAGVPGEKLIFICAVPSSRPADDYTARVVPYRPGVALPMELPLILWQR